MLDPNRLRSTAGGELRPLLRLAWPVVLAELGWMGMWVVDTMMVGRVSTEAIGGVSIGGHIFFAVAVFGMGMLLGLDYLVARAFGGRRVADANRALVDGVYLSVALTVLLTVFVWIIEPSIASWGIAPAVLRETVPYLHTVTWSLGPLLLYTTLRRYLQGMSIVKPVMVTLLSANLVNAAANWLLIFGHAGFPALGVAGAGWATCISRSYMFLTLLAYALYRERRNPTGLVSTPPAVHLKRMAALVRLGLPAACQVTLEVGVFAAATALAGRLDAASVAAHQIALSAAAFTFMVPLGVSSAGAVRVGQELGRDNPVAAQRAGWSALLVGAGFMLTSAALFILAPRAIIRAFTPDQLVIETGATLLLVAAAFQLFDGTQVVSTGILRGTGDTRTPMLFNLAGHWLLGLPIGYFLCFRSGWGILGLWIGLCTGLVAVASGLVIAWSRRSTVLAHRPFSARAEPVRLAPGD